MPDQAGVWMEFHHHILNGTTDTYQVWHTADRDGVCGQLRDYRRYSTADIVRPRPSAKRYVRAISASDPCSGTFVARYFVTKEAKVRDCASRMA